MRILLLGPPGSGKGTQSAFLRDEFDFKVVATGDLLRSAIKSGTPLGQKVEAVMSSGALVSDEIMIDVVTQYLQGESEVQHFLFDGFPRTIAQAKALREILGDFDWIIYFDIEFDTLVRRLSGRRIHTASGRIYHIEFAPPKIENKDDITGEKLIHRPDDQADSIKQRLAVYIESTQPLLDYYKELDSKGDVKLLTLDAAQNPEHIRSDILRSLKI